MKKKTKNWIYPILAITLVFMFNNHCTKDETDNIPVLTSIDVTDITDSTASSGGLISSDGNSEIIERGVCWALTTNPTTSSLKTNDGVGSGSFTSQVTGLQPSTTYYLRAYAVNSSGTAYGNELTFITNQHPYFPTTFQYDFETEYEYDNFSRLIGAVTTITITAAIDPDGDQLEYTWVASTGTITGNGLTAIWSRGISWGNIMMGTVSVTVSDGKGGNDISSMNFN